jgi:hypothetical protein
VDQKSQNPEAGEKQKGSPGLRSCHRKRRWITRLRQRIGWRGRCGGDGWPQQRIGSRGEKPGPVPGLDGGSRSFMATCTGAAACSGHIGPAVRNIGSMFTRAGTNGVDKSFSSGSCGEIGDLATSEMRFPQRVRACRKRITTSTGKRKFRIVGGEDRFAPRRFPKARDCRGAAGYY